ncbi:MULTISPECIES: hypothetical protein [unclassified Sphingosinithalassobacter]|uniref:hypothetical protein n=1 Tax=unclassified Sphingosinithalassobacter TaxID=2676235 RepID=UPI00165E28E9|nr:hypothetical protein [Sphingosinithalassobacter sp. CS137]
MSRARSAGAVFALPLLIALAGFVGLVAALTGDGWRDGIAWVGLGIPVAAVAWAMRVRKF